MACTNPLVPGYLRYDDQPLLRLADSDVIYRLGNVSESPLMFPSTLTAFSCKLARMYKCYGDLFLSAPGTVTVAYANTVRAIEGIRIDQEYVEPQSPHAGWHFVEAVVVHKPLPCDYPHVEILIRHGYSNGGEAMTHEYQYEDWPSSLLGRSKNRFFKELKTDYKRLLNEVFLRRRVMDDAAHQEVLSIS